MLKINIMHTNLLVNFYVDPNKERQKEITDVLKENLSIFDTVYILVSRKDLLDLETFILDYPDAVTILKEERPFYSDYFDIINQFSTDHELNVIANGDIVIPKETLELADKRLQDGKRCLALTRWDMQADGSSKFLDRADSQDVWIFKGRVKNVRADFNISFAGSDNRIAHELTEAGFIITNPSRTLRTFHVHLMGGNNYLDEKGSVRHFVEGPYKLIEPTF